MKIIEILSGIPNSGKSTYAKMLEGVFIISRDDIRENYFSKPYKYTNDNEKYTTIVFNTLLNSCLNDDKTHLIILDNTFCKEKYIDEIICKYHEKFSSDSQEKVIVKIKFFETSLIKAHIRNVGRYIKTGKWIPIKIMNSMYKNYNNIDKNKYKKYIV